MLHENSETINSCNLVICALTFVCRPIRANQVFASSNVSRRHCRTCTVIVKLSKYDVNTISRPTSSKRFKKRAYIVDGQCFYHIVTYRGPFNRHAILQQN